MPGVSSDKTDKLVIRLGTDAGHGGSRRVSVAQPGSPAENSFDPIAICCIGEAQPGLRGVCQFTDDGGLDD